ncbi:hypothetical protein M8494_35925 [Serratia ureilytica]
MAAGFPCMPGCAGAMLRRGITQSGSYWWPRRSVLQLPGIPDDACWLMRQVERGEPGQPRCAEGIYGSRFAGKAGAPGQRRNGARLSDAGHRRCTTGWWKAGTTRAVLAQRPDRRAAGGPGPPLSPPLIPASATARGTHDGKPGIRSMINNSAARVLRNVQQQYSLWISRHSTRWTIVFGPAARARAPVAGTALARHSAGRSKQGVTGARYHGSNKQCHTPNSLSGPALAGEWPLVAATTRHLGHDQISPHRNAYAVAHAIDSSSPIAVEPLLQASSRAGRVDMLRLRLRNATACRLQWLDDALAVHEPELVDLTTSPDQAAARLMDIDLASDLRAGGAPLLSP